MAIVNTLLKNTDVSPKQVVSKKEQAQNDDLERSDKSGKPCPICGLVVSNSYGLSCHLRRHKNDRPFKCELCSAAFILKSELQRHSRGHSTARPFKCNICPKDFKSWEGLRVHVDTHGLNEYACRHCDAKFKEYRSCTSHEKNYHNSNKLKCLYCYKTFSENRFRKEHMSLVHHKRNEPPTNKMHQKHAAKKQKLIKCFDEDFKFYPCKMCPERFKYRNDQLAHCQTSHKEEFSKFFKVCQICCKILTAKHYNDHMKAHEGDLPFKCVICDYKSARKVDVRIHMRVHKKNVFKCSLCDKSFKQNTSARLCEKKHSAKKEVKCKICDKTFFTVNELRAHKLTRHTNRKCIECGYETSIAHNLYLHKKAHKLEREAENREGKMCDKCGLLFETSKAFVQHLKTHSTNERQKGERKKKICSYCNYAGFPGDDILKHCIKFHPSKVRRCESCSYVTLNHPCFLNHLRKHVGGSFDKYRYFQIPESDPIVVLECFICGFVSGSNEIFEHHFKKHTQILNDFPWFSCEQFAMNLKAKRFRRRNSETDFESNEMLQKTKAEEK